MRILFTLVLTLDVILNSIKITSGMPPKESNFLANFGIKSEPLEHQEISVAVPPKERDFLTNFGIKSEPADHEELRAQSEFVPIVDSIPEFPRDGPSHFPDLNSPGMTLPPARRHSPEGTVPLASCHSPQRTVPLARRHSPERTVSLAKHHSPQRTLALDRRHLPERTTPLDRHHSSVRSEQPLCAEFSSLPLQKPISKVFGFKLEELRFIRLIPYKNSNRIFELRKYTFPTDNPAIELRKINDVCKPMPNEEQIVLSASNGDVYAILARNKNHTILRGLYTDFRGAQRRAKINVFTGAVDKLTPQEILETPLCGHDSISKNFKVERMSTTILHNNNLI